MGYQSNIFASNLRSKKTKNIGVLVPRLNSNFQSSVIAGMEKVANNAGFNLIISQSLENFEKECSNVESLFKSRVDGLLVSMAKNSNGTKHFDRFFNKGIPVIFFDRVADCDICTGVVIDNFNASYQATNHLLEQGCKRIVHVLGNTEINIYAERLKGYKNALTEHNISYDQTLIIIMDLGEDAGEFIVDQILGMETLPDGLFVSNDACAASCIKHLKLHNIRVPEDIAVVGFNNDPISRLVEPNITTVNYPGYEMGEIAMRNLINHLEGKDENTLSTTKKITLRSELLVRASSLKNN
ncbi:LacI family DNA-binding transcriptional regulator [Cecembia calidifontis]|uniref:LacI family transcriptional regulator n=1 Tax=Cecembia calidifontis TaxID=1187080 RepID=A0A4Q7PDV0_9BACT|nr:LacI family transcriptional regulator [Cecembia calidifontis]